MGIESHKITDADIARDGVIAAPDRLTGTAAQNKMVFDRLIRDVVAKYYNALIDELASYGADKAVLLPDGAGFKFLRLNGETLDLEVSADEQEWQTVSAGEAAERAEASARAAASSELSAAQSAAAAAESATDAQTALQGMVYVSFGMTDDGHVELQNGDLSGTTEFYIAAIGAANEGHMEVIY